MVVKPIGYVAPMVRGILAGRKTQTRRAIVPRSKRRPSLFDGTWTDGYVLDPGNAEWRSRDIPYAVGDLLWVREGWRADSQLDRIKPSDMSRGEPVRYEVDGIVRSFGCTMIEPGRLRWNAHMPRWASRLTLRVTDVRVQRVQEISEEDAIAEGVGFFDPPAEFMGAPVDPESAARSLFAALWDSLNAGRGYGWDANPWVIAVTFDVIKANVDDVLANEAA